MGPDNVGAFPHSAYRRNREVTQYGSASAATAFTVFVGLYNAVPYLEALIHQIEAQKLKDVHWLFIDNASSDDTWEDVNAWARESSLSTTLVRNGFNLGATGSIFVNLDLVTTEWVAFMHQDDVYLPTHFSTLAKAAAESSPNAVGVFSDMGRIRHTGRRIGSYPPPIWMVPDLEPATVFLSLLRNHCIPWPTLAVRTIPFRETESPWHSTAFPDTEITMRLAAKGTFVHIRKETMRYRDNAASESRSIDDRERKFGATVSLFRVFNSAEFGMLANSLPPEDRSDFVVGLRNAILVRLGETERAMLVIAGAFERLSQLWDHDEPTVLAELGILYEELGAHATSTLLKRMTSATGADPVATPAPLGIDIASPESIARPGGIRGSVMLTVQRSYEGVGFLVPYRIRRAMARAIIGLVSRRNPLSPWRFTWR